jgi:hypothetical protein
VGVSSETVEELRLYGNGWWDNGAVEGVGMDRGDSATVRMVWEWLVGLWSNEVGVGEGSSTVEQ